MKAFWTKVKAKFLALIGKIKVKSRKVEEEE